MRRLLLVYFIQPTERFDLYLDRGTPLDVFGSDHQIVEARRLPNLGSALFRVLVHRLIVNGFNIT